MNTHYLSKPETVGSLGKNGIQIIFCRNDHWIVATTLRCEQNAVAVYDSSYQEVDETTKKTLRHLTDTET